MHRVGGPVDCSTARIGIRTFLGLQESAPQGLGKMCATVGDIQKGWTFFGRIYLTGKVMCQGLTQLSYASDGVGGGRIRDPACYWTLLATLKVDSGEATGSARVKYDTW